MLFYQCEDDMLHRIDKHVLGDNAPWGKIPLMPFLISKQHIFSLILNLFFFLQKI